MTETIIEALDGGNFACGIFVDLQKAFDTVDHKILLSKLNHYGICTELANNWFESYLNGPCLGSDFLSGGFCCLKKSFCRI